MRSGVPWSVKGIEPEAREAAKQAARRAGVTLGAWLNQIIMDGGTDEVGMPDAEVSLKPSAPAPAFNQSVFSQPVTQPSVDLAPVAEAVREIVTRVEQSERRTQDLARRLEQSVGHLAERLEHTERSTERQVDNAMPDPRALDPLERKIQLLSERLEEAERGRNSFGRKGGDDNKAQLQTLEKAVNAVVDHLETAERRTDESLLDIRRTLSEIASRVDEREQEDAREEAQARERAMATHMQTLASRLEKMEQSVSSVGNQAVESALKAIADKTDAEQHKTTIANLQRSLGDITQRLERAESRTDETLKTFEMTVTGIARRLEELDNPRERMAVQAVESRVEEIADRLHQTEDMTLQAAQTIERAIAGMSDSMHVAENRSRETIDSLHVMLERMTDRLGRIERETKATRSTLSQATAPGMLPPQLAVGGVPMGGSGFVPGGQAFPIPNFDAPSIGMAGGGYGPVTEYREQGYESYRDAPMPAPVTPEHTFAPEIAPPPFAPGNDTGVEDGRREPKLGGMHSVEDDEPAQDEPAIEPARAANDFMAAARRAAQAAALNGRGGPQPMMGPNGYADSSARFTAVDDGEGRRKKIIYGAVAAVVLIAIALGAMRLMSNEPVIVAKTGPQAPAIEKTADAAAPSAAPADMGASTETTKPATTPVTVPAAPSAQPETVQSSGTAPAIPGATPEGAGATASAAAPASTTPVSPIVPAAKPAAPEKAAATPAPAAKKRVAHVTDGPAITPGPTLTPAPAKPVDSTPLGNVPPSERALRSAAASGNPAAQYEVGQRYANGENVPQDLAQAAYWYNQAADQGLAIAQYRLATLYEKGRGVAQDNDKARTWYEKAATQGNVKAMHNLAVIYAEGRGTRQDFTTASRWFSQAADFGLGDSQYNLAILQERGLGVKQDLVSAYKWLSIAAKGGDKGAGQKRDELAGKLDAATLAQGKVATETWAPKRPDAIANGDLSSMGSWATPGTADVTGSIGGEGARSDIGKAQAMLIKLGYDPGSSDGLMGPRTHDAILSYQRSAGLDQTGSVNRTLLKSLEIAAR
ncbi:MAG TPA: peptidoglycan-binding protein [Parvibaculum sp.]